jgi:hypothetical protein
VHGPLREQQKVVVVFVVVVVVCVVVVGIVVVSVCFSWFTRPVGEPFLSRG